MVIFDFETYYAADYSLSLPAYNTSAYIRDPQFLIHGCGFKVDGAQAYWVAGHDAALEECRKYEGELMIAHNMAFDGFILHTYGDIHPAQYGCTLCMARATMGHHMRHNLDTVAKALGFGGKTEGLVNTRGKRTLTSSELDALGAYCINDVNTTALIFNKLRPYMPDDEMRLIDLTMRMFCQPRLHLNTAKLEQQVIEEKVYKANMIAATNTNADVLMSNNKFADLLRELGVEPPMKISLRTGKTAYAFAKTDKGFKQLLEHEDEGVQVVARARQAVKTTINETRALRLLQAAPILPVGLNYAGAHTYRWSGSNSLNLQNLPRGGELRKSILAPPGHQLLIADLSQIEARLNVWFCGQTDILQAFRDFDTGVGEDVYKRQAAKMLSKKIEEITTIDRFQGKVGTLGLGFGMGHKKLRGNLAIGFLGNPPIYITEAEAIQQVNSYRMANPKIVAMWDTLGDLLFRMTINPELNTSLGPLRFKHKMIELPSGLALRYPGLNTTEDDLGRPQYKYLGKTGETKIYGSLLLENICQALARCIIGEQMLAIKHWFIAIMAHDELVIVVPNAEIDAATAHIRQVMTTPPDWAPDLPLAIHCDCDDKYSK